MTQRQQPNATRTTPMRDTKLSRRRLLTLGGATLAAGTLGGAAYAASPGRLLQSVGAGAGTGPQRRPPRRHRRLGRDPRPGHPGELLLPRQHGARGQDDLRLRLPRRHRLQRPAGAGPEGQDADLRAAAVVRRVPVGARQRRPGDRHEPRHAGPPGPHRRAHPALARLPQRDPVLRRRARDERRRSRSGATSPTSTSPRTRARTCTTATSRTSSTCRWA